MNVLVDTSVWSLVLRRARGPIHPHVGELERLVDGKRVTMIGPIRQEVLSGIRDERQFRRVVTRLAPFRDISLHTEDYVEAARCCNLCRKNGVQGSNTDFLICAVAARYNLAIYTTDKDFTQFAKWLPIQLHRPQADA